MGFSGILRLLISLSVVPSLLLFFCYFLLHFPCSYTRESSVVFLLSVFDTWLVLCVLSHSEEFDFMVHTNP